MPRILPLFAIALLITGCHSKLKQEATVQLEAVSIKTLRIDAPSHDQKVTVEFTSSDGPVDVYACLEKDEATVASSGDPSKAAGVLNKVEKSATGTLEFDVPAKVKAAVILTGARKNTTVTIKITGK